MWAPATCPAYGQPNALLPAEISIDRWQAKDFFGNTSHYARNTDRPWRFLVSQNVRYVALQFDRWHVPDAWDTLHVTHDTGTWWFHQGNPPYLSVDYLFQVKNPGGAQTGYLDFKWFTNGDTNVGLGYRINKLRFYCDQSPPPPQNATFVERNYPHDGYLLATDDVIYVRTKQPPGDEMGILVWPEEPDLDVDLYVSTTNSLPTLSNAQWTSRMGAGQPDMVIVPAHSGPGERWIYIAIGSYAGRGQFRFYANVHPAAYRTSLDVEPGFAPTSDHKDIIRKRLRHTTQALYFATDGRQFVRDWYLYWSGGAQSDPYMLLKDDSSGDQCMNMSGSSPCFNGGTRIEFGRRWCRPISGCAGSVFTCGCENTQDASEQWSSTAVHEWGHCVLGLPDERAQIDPNYTCGHSLMWGGRGPVLSANMMDFCDGTNGGTYPEPGGSPPYTGHNSADNNWNCIHNRFPSWSFLKYTHTPDAFHRSVDWGIFYYLTNLHE